MFQAPSVRTHLPEIFRTLFDPSGGAGLALVEPGREAFRADQDAATEPDDGRPVAARHEEGKVPARYGEDFRDFFESQQATSHWLIS